MSDLKNETVLRIGENQIDIRNKARIGIRFEQLHSFQTLSPRFLDNSKA
jgi:hypothetical protein